MEVARARKKRTGPSMVEVVAESEVEDDLRRKLISEAEGVDHLAEGTLPCPTQALRGAPVVGAAVEVSVAPRARTEQQMAKAVMEEVN